MERSHRILPERLLRLSNAGLTSERSDRCLKNHGIDPQEQSFFYSTRVVIWVSTDEVAGNNWAGMAECRSKDFCTRLQADLKVVVA